VLIALVGAVGTPSFSQSSTSALKKQAAEHFLKQQYSAASIDFHRLYTLEKKLRYLEKAIQSALIDEDFSRARELMALIADQKLQKEYELLIDLLKGKRPPDNLLADPNTPKTSYRYMLYFTLATRDSSLQAHIEDTFGTDLDKHYLFGSKSLPPSKKSESATAEEMFTVQLASFSSMENAQRFSRSLPAHLPSVHIEEAQVKSSTFYRVRLGQFASREQAEAFLQSHPKLKGSIVHQ